ncbi:MAG: SMC-Scp complex subunit ScpB [Planctomycetota bacterium]
METAPPDREDDATEAEDAVLGFDVDLETAYRQAMEAVDGAGIADEQPPNEDVAGGEETSEDRSGRPPTTVGPRRVLEAALFVGANEEDANARPALSRKTLARLLGDAYDEPAIERMLGELADAYDREGRPFRVVSGEGGYRLELREEFDGVRHRVFGTAPRDVRLSSAAVETLALVAYEQPLTRKQADARAGRPLGSTLGTLVRCGLVRVDEGDRYVTTPRFLEAVGLGSLDDLPRVGRLGMK